MAHDCLCLRRQTNRQKHEKEGGKQKEGTFDRQLNLLNANRIQTLKTDGIGLGVQNARSEQELYPSKGYNPPYISKVYAILAKGL